MKTQLHRIDLLRRFNLPDFLSTDLLGEEQIKRQQAVTGNFKTKVYQPYCLRSAKFWKVSLVRLHSDLCNLYPLWKEVCLTLLCSVPFSNLWDHFSGLAYSSVVSLLTLNYRSCELAHCSVLVGGWALTPPAPCQPGGFSPWHPQCLAWCRVYGNHLVLPSGWTEFQMLS